MLDLGCGTGGLTRRLAELVGPDGRVLGIDPDEARIALARRTAGAPNLEFQVAAAETLGEVARDRPFDLVFSNFVFHWRGAARPGALVGTRRLTRPHVRRAR